MPVGLQAHELVEDHACPACGGAYPRVYGDLFDDDKRAGVYSADLHLHGGDRRSLLALGVLEWIAASETWRKCSATLEVWSDGDQFRMGFCGAEHSPYRENQLMGRVLEREEALAHPLRDWLFLLAEHIVLNDPRVASHFEGASANRSSANPLQAENPNAIGDAASLCPPPPGSPQ